jgi:hypothetical protein
MPIPDRETRAAKTKRHVTTRERRERRRAIVRARVAEAERRASRQSAPRVPGSLVAALDREDRAALAKDDAAEHARITKARKAHARFKREGVRVGRLEEDGSFRVGRGTFDPDTGKVRGGAPPHDFPTPRTALGARDEPGRDARDKRRAEERRRRDRPTTLERLEDSRKRRERSGFLGSFGGLGRAAAGDVKEIGYGIADTAADYGTALYRDVRDPKGRVPFRRTGRLVARDALGLVASAEEAIPEPSFLPEWMRKEVVTVDPENVRVGLGSGKVDEDDSARAGRFWKENPLIGALLVTPAVSTFARRASRGALEGSIRRANAPTHFHGTGKGGRKLSTGEPDYDRRFFVTPDRAVAQRYADRHVGPTVQEFRLRPDARVLRPELDPRDYTPERLAAIVRDAEAQGYHAVDFGGGAGIAVIDRSVIAEAPRLSRRDVRRIARLESKMPGRAAAHGIAGGIEPRVIRGEFGEAVGRPWSRTPIGRAGQRGYDRASQLVEARFGPGAKFSSSQRAARMRERGLRKGRARTEAEVVRLERAIRKGVGKLGRSPAGREALIATLEAPRGLTPRQAVEVKLADLRSTIERPQTADEAQARVAALEKELTARLRPIVDELYPPASRRREQALRNARPRGKRAQRGIENELELSGIRGSRAQGGSVLADAYALVEEKTLELAARPDADPSVRRAAALIEERNRLREQLSDPDVVFGDAVGDYGMRSATPANRRRLEAEAAALERALADGVVDSDEFARAVAAAEALSARAEGAARSVLGMSDEELAARRNVVAQRYAERGLLPEGVEPEARGFFPHREVFENVGPGRGGAVGMPAAGFVVGRPTPGRSFERRPNELRLYESGRVQNDPRVLSNTVRQRERFLATQNGRRYLYEQGAPIRRGEAVPEGYMLVRNPDASPEDIPANVRAAIENPERYAELAERSGAFPESRTFAGWLDTWLYRGHGPEPEWLVDLDNVRAVPEGVARTLLSDVFASAPRGSVASIFGSLNALARATTIYLPYGGARYVARNTPQNMILLAMTQPRAFLRLRRSIVTLRRDEPDVFEAIKAEAGTIPAAAGLPELAGRRQSRAQRLEGAMTEGSRRIAGVLGEVTDEPWRVASWLEYARAYGFDTPSERRRLLESDAPEIARVRDDIAQRVREDMIDFDALPPWARENLSRYLFILPFVYGAGKWPFIYLRERPTRAAVLALIASQHEREETPGRATSVLEAGRTEIGGREVDLGWLNPAGPAAGTIEDLAKSARGLDPRDGSVELRPLAGMLSPQYRSLVDSAGYGGEPVEQVARAFVPGYGTVERLREGGGVDEQALRFLGSDIRYIEPTSSDPRAKVAEESRRVLTGLRQRRPELLRENPQLERRVRQAYSRKAAVDAARAEVRREHPEGGEGYQRAALLRELGLLRSWGAVGERRAEEIADVARTGTLEDVEDWRATLREEGFESEYLELLRQAREAAGVGS